MSMQKWTVSYVEAMDLWIVKEPNGDYGIIKPSSFPTLSTRTQNMLQLAKDMSPTGVAIFSDETMSVTPMPRFDFGRNGHVAPGSFESN